MSAPLPFWFLLRREPPIVINRKCVLVQIHVRGLNGDLFAISLFVMLLLLLPPRSLRSC